MPRDLSTEQKILAAARKVFQSKGMHGARMQDIADTAGINKALLHYYFRSKDQLFEAVFKEALQQLFPKIELLANSAIPLPKKIEQFVHGYMDVLMEHPFLPGFVLHEINQDPDKFERLFIPKGAVTKNKKFLQQIAEEVKKGAINPIDPRQLMVNMLSLCIFPFAAKPMICKVMGMNEKEFRQFIAQRKQLIPSLIIQSISRR
ncbi:MAG TPA: TetR/AcrR family transcriptional regulator [Chitinophagales bacterium]|nr:TetR/AcrR family transcriptional regulator [Chitinophagales bacterium]